MSTRIRVRCTLDNAGTVINGIRFGRAQHESGEVFRVSEPVDPEVVATMLTIPGFERFEGGAEACAAIDDAIAAAAMSEVAEATGDTEAQRTIEELQRANMAMADELSQARASGDPTAIAVKDAEIARLRGELASARDELEGVAGQVETAVAEAKALIDELKGKLQTAEKQVSEKETELAAARTELQDAKDDASTALRTALEEVQGKLDAAVAQGAEKDAELSAAKTRIAELEQANAALAESGSAPAGGEAVGGAESGRRTRR